MRPKKKVLIYHPNERQADLYRYAMAVTLEQKVFIASTPEALKDPKDFNVTVLWTVEAIEIRNLRAKTIRTLPTDASNLELMLAVRMALSRKSNSRRGVHKDREEKQAPVVITRVRDVVKEIGTVERMMSLACPKRRRYAA